MRYRSSRLFEFVILCLLFVNSASAQTLVRVNEHEVRIQFLSEDTVVDLPLENQTRAAIAAHLLLELIDPSGIVRDKSEQDISLPPGETKLKASLPLATALANKIDRKNLLWYLPPKYSPKHICKGTQHLMALHHKMPHLPN